MSAELPDTLLTVRERRCECGAVNPRLGGGAACLRDCGTAVPARVIQIQLTDTKKDVLRSRFVVIFYEGRPFVSVCAERSAFESQVNVLAAAYVTVRCCR